MAKIDLVLETLKARLKANGSNVEEALKAAGNDIQDALRDSYIEGLGDANRVVVRELAKYPFLLYVVPLAIFGLGIFVGLIF